MPARWEICARCEGDGHHSNPAIDGNGITQSEWAEWEADEREAYMSGRYDIGCKDCGSTGKLLVVDEELFERQDSLSFRKWKESERKDNEYRDMVDSEARWERRMLYGSDY